MKILVTGADGFVGKHLLNELKKTDYTVLAIDKNSIDENIISCEICNYSSLLSLIKNFKPEIILHLAAISMVDFKNFSKIYDVNVTGTINLLQSIADTAINPFFIFISSSQVYGKIGENKIPMDESSTINPINHYGISKLTGEKILQKVAGDLNFPYIILRPFNHIGVGQNKHFFVPKLIDAIRKKNDSIELGNLNIVRDFLDVRDVVDVYTSIINKQNLFLDTKILNISSGRPTELKKILNLSKEISRHTIKIKSNDTYRRTDEIFYAVGNNSKLKKILNWRPKYKIEDTIKWMLED